MTAETKPPFDPEAEARRLTVVCCEHTIPLRPTQNRCIHCITAALSRAFEAGAADMRERTAALFDVPLREPETPMQAVVAPTLRRVFDQSAARIRDLPLSETR